MSMIDHKGFEAVRLKLETLAKSFTAAGYQGMQQGGRTGLAAMGITSIDPVMQTITLSQDQFKLTKGIQIIKATQSVYQYRAKIANGTSGLDLAGFENFMPGEDSPEYITVTEPLKVYGIRSTIGQMVELTNAAGGYDMDMEKEADETAAFRLAESMERDGYAGGDYFIAADGQIDVEVPLRSYGSARVPGIRNARGIQNNIREGNTSARGIPGDLAAYGGSFETIKDLRGAVLDRDALEDITTAVQENLGGNLEAHSTPSQNNEFRKTFFPLERAMVSERWSVNGSDVSTTPDATFSVMTGAGPVKFIPTVMKHSVRQKPIPVSSTLGTAPASPVISSIAQAAAGSPLLASKVYRFVVQAVNMAGMSAGTTTAPITVTVSGSGIDLTIAAQPGVEYFNVFVTPSETAGAAGRECFAGRVVAARAGATAFRFVEAIVPGLESVLLLPTTQDRVKLAVLGNLINKVELGRLSLSYTKAYASYFAFVVHKPRSFALLDNVFQRRR